MNTTRPPSIRIYLHQKDFFYLYYVRGTWWYIWFREKEREERVNFYDSYGHEHVGILGHSYHEVYVFLFRKLISLF